MDKSDIHAAIVLFANSRTAQTSRRAPEVIRALWDLFRRDEVGFHVRRAHSLGAWVEDRDGFDLQVNIVYVNRLPQPARLGAVSLVLVHEATHAVGAFPRLYEELAARVLQVHYYRELSGPGVFDEANDPPRPGRHWGLVRIAPADFPSYQKQSEALRRDQLIDHILGFEGYQRRRYIGASWVLRNLPLWGGLRNRLPRTRGLYVRVLASEADLNVTARILDIMESIDRREDWAAMMATAAPLHSVRLALDELSNTRPQFSLRIGALERRWGLTLRETPPRR